MVLQDIFRNNVLNTAVQGDHRIKLLQKLRQSDLNFLSLKLKLRIVFLPPALLHKINVPTCCMLHQIEQFQCWLLENFHWAKIEKFISHESQPFIAKFKEKSC